ncbi:MAG: HEAT repeat domain-containing protein [Chloroflexi bacterium]|nr:HEAT repeat domain-containing protein [Chloroflexota bacterium]MCI0575438.1 HEAT repeat domain-containing protein [Chloroflexota bacterium]MCI0649880.1 HEAT repeat domain-containing protein [Chloroflexota bacterium]MCI0725650.1 HEAT repeat domain-containing protein [Chloroflexota bacterium]
MNLPLPAASSAQVALYKRRERQALALLVGQMFFLSLALALLNVAAYTLFLVAFESNELPYVYLAVAGCVSLTSFGLLELQKRWPLARIVPLGLALFGALFLSGWAGLTLSGAPFFSLAMMVAVSLLELTGAILIGGQAGHLLDVRQMKTRYPLVTTGLIAAYIVGGLLVGPLLRLLGEPAHLLLVSAGSTAVALVLALLTARHFGDVLGQVAGRESRPARPSLRWLAQKPYVRRIFAYQLLSAVATQLALFLYFAQAERHYSRAADLARFFGNLNFGRGVAGLLFTGLLAGRLLSRYGLRLGLVANPAGVAVILALMLPAAFWPAAGGLLFWLAVAAYLADLMLTDGMTNTAIKTAYQALPDAEQAAVSTIVEGVGIPLAFGLAGLFLLLVAAVPALSLAAVVALTLAVNLLWTTASLATYRSYAGELLQKLRRRGLRQAPLWLEDSSSLAVIQKLLDSDNLVQVRLALEALAQATPPALENALLRLLAHPGPEMQQEALRRLAGRPFPAALPAVQVLLDSPSSEVRGQALQTLCTLGGKAAVPQVTPYLTDPDPAVRLPALAGLLRDGGADGRQVAWEPLLALTFSPGAAERIQAAQVIGNTGQALLAQLLQKLLADSDPAVRLAALAAAGETKAPELLPAVLDNLAAPTTRPAALEALRAQPDVALETIHRALSGEMVCEPPVLASLVRLAGRQPTPEAARLLLRHLEYPDPDIQSQVLSALHASPFSSQAMAGVDWQPALSRQVAWTGQLRLAAQAAAGGPAKALAPLQRALQQAFRQTRQRLFYLLAFQNRCPALLSVEEHLESGDLRRRALALETLEVNLTKKQKGLILPLVDEDRPPAGPPSPWLNPATMAPEPDGWLAPLLAGTVVGAGNWSRACAIYAVACLKIDEHVALVEAALQAEAAVVRETAAWALRRLAPQRYLVLAAPLHHDPDPQVARLAAYLATTSPGDGVMLLTIERVALLKTVEIFANTPDAALAAVAQVMEEVEVAVGQTFIHEGDIGDCLYVIVEGQVRVHSAGQTIIVLGPGKSVGELAVLDPEPRVASATAVTPTFLFRLDQTAFEAVMADRPEIARDVIQALCRRLREEGRSLVEAQMS